MSTLLQKCSPYSTVVTTSNRQSLTGMLPDGFSIIHACHMFYLLFTGKKLWPESSLLFPGFIQKRNITLLTTFKVIDNSALGQRVKKNRQPYLIGFYRKRKTADPGDVIRVAVAGKTNKAIVIGTRKTKHHTVPRYDNNCIVLVDENLAPLGTRIKGPVPTILRRRQDKYSKVLALASRFIWCGLDSFSSMP